MWWLLRAMADTRPLPASAGSRGARRAAGPYGSHPVQLSSPARILSLAPPRAPSSVTPTQRHCHTGLPFPALYPQMSPGRELGSPQLALQISRHLGTAGLHLGACDIQSLPLYVLPSVCLLRGERKSGSCYSISSRNCFYDCKCPHLSISR